MFRSGALRQLPETVRRIFAILQELGIQGDTRLRHVAETLPRRQRSGGSVGGPSFSVAGRQRSRIVGSNQLERSVLSHEGLSGDAQAHTSTAIPPEQALDRIISDLSTLGGCQKEEGEDICLLLPSTVYSVAQSVR